MRLKMKMCALCGAGHIEDQCPNCFPNGNAITPVGGGNDTILHLPNGDFQTLREDRLKDPEQLQLMLEPGNFGRAFPYWQKIAEGLGIDSIHNTALAREYLRARLGLDVPTTAW